MTTVAEALEVARVVRVHGPLSTAQLARRTFGTPGPLYAGLVYDFTVAIRRTAGLARLALALGHLELERGRGPRRRWCVWRAP